jgi:hypothetical protein
MIKARASIDDRETVILGLSTKNIWRLQKNEPIRFDGRPYGIPMDVMIMWGVDEQDIARKLGVNPDAPGDVAVTWEKNAP